MSASKVSGFVPLRRPRANHHRHGGKDNSRTAGRMGMEFQSKVLSHPLSVTVTPGIHSSGRWRPLNPDLGPGDVTESSGRNIDWSGAIQPLDSLVCTHRRPNCPCFRRTMIQWDHWAWRTPTSLQAGPMPAGAPNLVHHVFSGRRSVSPRDVRPQAPGSPNRPRPVRCHRHGRFRIPDLDDCPAGRRGPPIQRRPSLHHGNNSHAPSEHQC
ncbi:MAG: hypothetical protein Ct9H300mP1_06050 [Planctomycetaceae bacterium]|nr:MAG: hypothetical protein Ct9H300mP1_06050 [Planctomycetaceae bacterium]